MITGRNQANVKRVAQEALQLSPHALKNEATLTYSMAKAALDMMTKVLAVELGSSGIRVNTINAGNFDTNFIKVVAEQSSGGLPAGLSEQLMNVIKQKAKDLVPLKITADPIEVAKAVVFLASSDAQYITGANIVVDGGVVYNTPANFFSTIFNTTGLY